MGRSHDQRHPVGVRAHPACRGRGVLPRACARGAGTQPHHRRSAGSAAPRSRHRARLVVRQEVPAAAPGCAARLGRHPRGARRLRARDQVIAHPAAGAGGADRWRARDPGHHRGVGATRLTHAATLADQLVGFDDLLRALLGVRHHRFRQAVRLELVGMMAVQLPAVGLDDRLIARARAGLEHAIGLLERAVACRGATRLTRARAATLDAQHRLDVRQLEGRDPQCGGDPRDQRPHRAFQTVAGERRAHLDLEEHAQQVRPPAAGASEGGELAAEVECGELAGAEAGDRLAHLRAIEAQLAHDGARGGDFQLRHAAVGLGETAHDTEGGAEEALADRSDVLACERPRLQLLAVLIELMPEQHAERGPDRTERDRALLAGRAVIVRRLQALPIEAVVRGYLIGSGWKDYQASGRVCGIALPRDLKLAGRLPQPLFTPATKARIGAHDENISFEEVAALIGAELAAAVRDTALALYGFAAEHARSRGILIADSKFEFGLDSQGRLTLIDEVLTPDSSRFWPADSYRAGVSPPSFDKQFVRDYLETLDWNKQAPGPKLPPEIIARTSDKYREALARLTG